jgi:hypothetical protein
MDFESLVEGFLCPEVRAIALAGSFARGDWGVFSDIDLVRFLGTDAQPHDAETHLIGEHFVVVSDIGPSKVESCFTDPVDATEYIAGLRMARALWDPDGHFDAIRERAHVFVWEGAIKDNAHAWASTQMVGWIEEVHKGLEGLRRGDQGRMLNARYGLSWGLTKVMRVQRGILISSDNGSYPEVVEAIGPHSEWGVLSRKVFGIDDTTDLPDQVKAGLRLYVVTAGILASTLKPEDKKLVDEAVNRIREELKEAFNQSMEATS